MIYLVPRRIHAKYLVLSYQVCYFVQLPTFFLVIFASNITAYCTTYGCTSVRKSIQTAVTFFCCLLPVVVRKNRAVLQSLCHCAQLYTPTQVPIPFVLTLTILSQSLPRQKLVAPDASLKPALSGGDAWLEDSRPSLPGDSSIICSPATTTSPARSLRWCPPPPNQNITSEVWMLSTATPRSGAWQED